jgi:hypothetical protein
MGTKLTAVTLALGGLFAVAAACAVDKAPPASPAAEAHVGASGGSVDAEGVTLTVPPGALAADQDIRITKTADPPPDGTVAYSAVYRFEPEGLKFAVPVKVSFARTGSEPNPVVLWKSADGPVETLGGDVTDGSVVTSVTHFSIGWLGAGGSGSPDAGNGTADASTLADAGLHDASAPPDGGSCTFCLLGQSCCGSSCVDTSASTLHCGQCNHVCPTGSPVCVNGICSATP